MEFTLFWAAVTAAAFVWLGTRLWPEGLPDHPVDRMLGAAAVGLLTGRLVAMAIQGINPLSRPGDILVVRGGVHTGAATAGALAAYLWSVKGRVLHLDAVAPSALLGLAGWHGGCLWRGACLGAASDLAWAWGEPGSLVTRHPVEVYAAIAFGAAAWAVSRLPLRPLLRSGIALAAAGAVRLLTEPLRLTLTGGPWPWYAAAVVLGLLVALIGPRLLAGQSSQLESAPAGNETSSGGASDNP
jgi:prolipoprotein diacylglyceryltransferase